MEIIMAPLRGVTTATYRKIYKKIFGGIDSAIAPFIPTGPETKVTNRLVKDVLPENNIDSYPIIPQIIGNRPEELPAFLNKLIELGLPEVNWNLGCPAPMVAKKKRGSGAIQHPALIESYVKVLDEHPGINYSIKIRAGFSDPTELYELLPIFEKHNCARLIIHPRTGQQAYRGRVDVEAFSEVCRRTTLPLVYNGDVFSMKLFNEIVPPFKDRISGLMLGRGILINPYLPEQISGKEIPSNPNERIYELMKQLFAAYSEELFGENPVLGRMKELWQYLHYSFPEGQQNIKRILKCTSFSAYLREEEKLFATPFIPPSDYPDLDF